MFLELVLDSSILESQKHRIIQLDGTLKPPAMGRAATPKIRLPRTPSMALGTSRDGTPVALWAVCARASLPSGFSS